MSGSFWLWQYRPLICQKRLPSSDARRVRLCGRRPAELLRTADDYGHLPVEAEQLTQHFMRQRHAPLPAQNGRWRTILNTQA